MEEQDKVKYQELKERTENVLFDNVKGQIDVSKHRQLIVDIVDTVGKDVEKITDNSADMNQKFEEYKESQSELNAKQDIDINKNLQNINQLNDMIKVLSQKDEPIMSANGGGVLNLPNNAMRSVAPNYRFEGLTLQNLDINGYEEEVVQNQNMRQLPIGMVGDLMYVRADIFVNAGGYLNHYIGGKFETGINKKIVNKYIPYSIKFKVEELKHYFVGNARENQSKTKNRIIINLTQTFGAGNEPSKEWCDEHIQGYFEGLKSVQTPMRVRSESGRVNYLPLSNVDTFGIKNDKKTTNSNETKSGKIVALTNIENTMDGNYNLHWRLKNELPTYKKGTKFQLSFLIRVDKDCETGWSFNGTVVHNTTPAKLKANELTKIAFDCEIDVENSEHYNAHLILTPQPTKLEYGDMKLEIGDSPTEWIPHISESSLSKGNMMYINNQLELKSVGTAKDYIENGKLYKNVGVLSDISVGGTESLGSENYEVWMLRKPLDFTFGQPIQIGSYQSTKTRIVDATDEDLYKVYTPTSYYGALDFGFLTKKGEFKTNVEVYNKFFKGVKMYYKQDETEVINLDTSGLITNHPNGTIFIEPITNVTAYYNDGLDVSNFNIESVEEFAIFKDGNYQSLDVSKVEITDNKLTHPNAINGLCYLVFRYDNVPIFGDNEVEYYNNDGILVSPDGTFWKPVLTVDDEGNILMKGEKL